VIVETHSDHLVNRIRRRVAEDDGDILSRLLAVYFAEPAGRGPQFTRVDFDELACTKMWPKGFFDQANIDNRALLEVQFRKIDQKGDKR
jgi:predicted ATPase